MELIRALLVLQERDQRAKSLRQELENIPREAERIDKKLAQERAHLDKLREDLNQTEADRKKIDLEVQSKEQQVAKYKSQQTLTKKNEEYQALSHEIEHGEQQISDLETKELELMERLDELKAAITEEVSTFSRHEKEAEEARTRLNQKKANLSEQAGQVEAEHQEAYDAVEEGPRGLYERLVKGKKPDAVVPIVDSCCAGCHMKLTPTTINQAQAGEKLTQCDNCGRIVYVEP